MPKTVPAGLLGRTLRCLAVLVVRKDGVHVGLTDTNRPFTLGGVTYSPVTGVAATSIETDLGASGGSLSFRTLEGVEDGLAIAITAEDLRAGVYREADVWVYELDPSDPGLGVIIQGRYRIVRATIKRAEKTIQLRETLSLLSLQTGRTVGPHCDVTKWADKRCDPSQTIRAANSHSRTLLTVSAPDVLLFGGDSQPDGFYSYGEVEWTTGRNAGLTMQIKLHEALPGSVARITLSTPAGSLLAGFPATAGDVATLVRGCDRRFATCQSIPNATEATGTNAPNFQGWNKVPLPDDAARVGRQAK